MAAQATKVRRSGSRHGPGILLGPEDTLCYKMRSLLPMVSLSYLGSEALPKSI